MKKFLAIFTIVAMLSGMCTIGASAAVDALDATIELAEATGVTTTVDIASGFQGTYSYSPSAANFAALASDTAAVMHYLTDYNTGANAWYMTGSGSTSASDFRGFAVKIPGFFKDKPAGQYKINMSVCARNSTGASGVLNMGVLNVGATVNKGSYSYYSDANGIEAYNPGGATWSTKNVELTFNYPGVTAITAEGVDASLYDPYALCVYVMGSNGGQFYMSGFSATAPFDPGKTVKATNTMTVSEDAVLINALYDGEGNLLSVNTKDITSSDATASLALPYTGEAAYNWTFKGFIWKDLDSTIEPLAQTEEISLGTLIPYVYELDFNNWTGGWGDSCPRYSLVPTDANFIGLKTNTHVGPCRQQSGDTYWRNSAQWGQNPKDSSDIVMKTAGMLICIPEFFKGKPAGTYTIEYDYYDTATSATWTPMKGRVLSVGDLVNGTVDAASLTGGASNVTGNGSTYGTWEHATLEFQYDGNVVAIEGENADLYDPYMLVFWAGRGRDTQYCIDNIRIEAPFNN